MDDPKKELESLDIGAMISDMVKIKSYSFMPEQERETANYIEAFFRREGIPCEVVRHHGDRYNVTAVLKGSGHGRSLMLSGHMDTVPAYDMEDAFSGKISGGCVHGRGACDMKGPLAAMMAAQAAIHRSGVKLDGDLYFTGVADEEEKGFGTKYLIEHGPRADGVIVGEPTDMKIAPGHKGLEWIEVTFTGKKVHGGRQKEGINAIEMAARFINKIYSEYVPVLDSREYPVLGAPTINVGTIEGGDQPSTVPDRCVLKLDRRMVPTETIPQVYGELEAIGNGLHEEDSRFSCTVRDVFEGDDLLPHIPFLTSDDDPLMQAAKSACAKNGVKPVIEPFPAWTDAGFIADQTDSKCIVMGPGKLSLAHSAGELIRIADARLAAAIYIDCAIGYCGIAG